MHQPPDGPGQVIESYEMHRYLKNIAGTILAAAVVFAFADPVAAQKSLAEGFGKMKLQAAPGGKGYSRVKLSNGSIAERFVLRPGDCPRQGNDCDRDRERIEFYDSNPRVKVASEVWYAYSIYLPQDFAAPLAGRGAPNLILGQVHQLGTSGPEVLFLLDRNGFFIKLTDPYRLDDGPMNPVPNFRWDRLASTGSILGRWTRVELHAKWSRGEDGFLEVFLNGRKVWSYKGATTNANDPLYFRYGLYRSFVSRCRGPCPEI